MFKTITTRFKAYIAKLKHEYSVSTGEHAEARYNRKWDMRFAASNAGHRIAQDQGSYADWYRQVSAVKNVRRQVNEAAQVLH